MTTDHEPFPPRTELTDKLTEKEYRHAFVGSRVRRGLPLQIRAMREAREWNQQELGEHAGIPQANVSRIENTRDSFLSFPTLLKIAEAFDVALVVKFAPFSELEELATRPLPELVPPDYAVDSAEREAWKADASAGKDLSQYWLQVVNERNRHSPMLGEQYGTRGDSQSDRGVLHALRAAEPHAKSGRPDVYPPPH